MTYRQFMKRHRIPDEELLSLLWDTSDEWRKAVGSISPDRHRVFLETVHLGVKATEVDGKLKIEDPGKPVLDSPIDEKRAHKWLVENKYAEKQPPKKRQEILQKTAAVLIGIAEKTIGRWDKGKHRPKDYPGRHSARLLNMFAAQYRKDKGLPPLYDSEYLPE